MKKSVLILVFTIFLSVSSLFAQKNDSKAAPQQANPQIPTFQTSLIVEDIMFAATALNTVEISGSEVDAFVQCKNNLQGVVKYIQTNNLKNSDTLSLNFQYPVAQALVGFMTKAKFMGSQVENYKRFIDGIVESAKKTKSQETKK